ncbi:MAG TPA: ABC transporter ATP-binding protein [Burkholderiaceae bacterium]|nr:ABC transporter ATP-binding protein [Burkholderiaceae bacterium]
MLSVQSLHKSFGANRAVDDVSFRVAAGEIVALIGPNGAGKTTTFNMLNGQMPADSGQVRLGGKDILGLSPRHIARLGVGRTFQVAATFPSMTVQENVQMALAAHHRRVFRLWSRMRDQFAAQALSLLDQVQMADQATRSCSELAYGDVKRVELAMALAAGPRLMLMDEPTAGMAPSERHAMMGLTRELARQRNMAVLFTEHSMDVVFAWADRIIVLARGRIVADGDPAAIRANPDVQRVYFGSGTTFTSGRP